MFGISDIVIWGGVLWAFCKSQSNRLQSRLTSRRRCNFRLLSSEQVESQSRLTIRTQLNTQILMNVVRKEAEQLRLHFH